MYNYIYDWFYSKLSDKLVTQIKPFLSKNDRVLDLGSGNGYIARVIKMKIGCKVTCLDVININKVGPNPIIYDGYSIPFTDDIFDIILIIFVLHHVKDKKRVITEAARVSSSRLLIVDDIYQDIFDKVIGFGHKFISKIKWKSSFVGYKNDKEWKLLFKDLNLNLIYEKSVSRFINPTHPASRKLYFLQKQNG